MRDGMSVPLLTIASLSPSRMKRGCADRSCAVFVAFPLLRYYVSLGDSSLVSSCPPDGS
jgi:hypothetical protein